eukprot:911572-Amphidinium_carterae.1
MDCLKVITLFRWTGHLHWQAAHCVSTPRSLVVTRGGGNLPARQTFLSSRFALAPLQMTTVFL